MALTPSFHLSAYFEDLPEGEDFLIKSDSGEPIEAPFSAIMSTEDRDGQGDEVDQDGLEVEQFIKSGKFNYEHGKGAAYVIGYPVSAEKTTLENGKKATRVHGRLYLTKKLGRETYETMRAMSKSAGDRRMGLSVEGPVLKRDPVNRRRIVKSRVTNCAITDNPANPFARVDMVKSLQRHGWMLKAEDGEFEEPEEEEEEGLEPPEPEVDAPPALTDDAPPPALPEDAGVEMPLPPVDAGLEMPPPRTLTAGDIALVLLQFLPETEHNQIVSLARAIEALANAPEL